MADKVEITITGAKGIFHRLDLSKKGANAGLTKGLKLAAKWLQAKSRLITPVDTGVLQKSIIVSPIRKEGGDKVISVFSKDVKYAIHVHENPDLTHKPGKTYKFLERPAKEEKDQIRKIIADSVSEGIRKALRKAPR